LSEPQGSRRPRSGR